MAGVSSETKSPLSDTPVPFRALQHCWVRCLSAQSSCDPNDSSLTGSDFLSAPGRAELLEAGTVETERGEAMPQGRRGCSVLMSNLRHPELFRVPAANPGAVGDRHTLLSVSLWAGKPQVQQCSGRNSSLQCPCPKTGTRDMCQEKRGRNPIKTSDFWTKGVLCSCHVLTGMGLHSSPPRAWFVGAGGHSGSWPGTHHISISQTIFKSR